MREVLTAAAVSLAVSVIYNRIAAIHTFNVIDGHVREMIDVVEKLVWDACLNKRNSKGC